jgi:metal-sulfur cluster biosynthetic enzyme
MTSGQLDLADQVRDALRIVVDPELGYNIVDLGFVHEVVVQDSGDVRIVMTTTTRGCPATDFLQQGARDSASIVPGIGAIDVIVTHDPPWTPELMSPDAKQYFGISDAADW